MKKVVAFIGRAGSGKDYQCSLLEKEGYTRLAFADALRDIAFSSLSIDYKEGMKYYDWFKSNICIHVNGPTCDTSSNFSFRTFLEKLGTQGIRKYCSDFWVQALINTIKNTDRVCISDMRFINEYVAIYEYCKETNTEFECIFCDYRSDRYQEVNNHESVWLSNKLVELGYKDLQRIERIDIHNIQEENK